MKQGKKVLQAASRCSAEALMLRDMGADVCSSFLQTDPENTDYTMEHGATRKLPGWRSSWRRRRRGAEGAEDEELNNSHEGKSGTIVRVCMHVCVCE